MSVLRYLLIGLLAASTVAMLPAPSQAQTSPPQALAPAQVPSQTQAQPLSAQLLSAQARAQAQWEPLQPDQAVPAQVELAPGGRYGEVLVAEPSGQLRGFMVLFSPLSGWRDADQQAAELLARHGVLVVGVNTARYAATLAGTPEACHHLVDDVEGTAHLFERKLRSTAYFTPIVAGTAEGGMLADYILSVAATNTIAGAVSIDPVVASVAEPASDPTVPPQPTIPPQPGAPPQHTGLPTAPATALLDPRFKPCPPDPTVLYDRGLPGFWGVGITTPLPGPIQAQVASLRQLGSQADIRDFAQGTQEGDIALALVEPHLGSRAPDELDVSDLPLVELPAEHASNMLAVVLSGDGGWRDLDKTIARNLQASGVSVVGLDSLRYFWTRKSPGQTAHDIARVIATFAQRWHATSVALIGYSFGADVLPFVYNRLSAATRGKVQLLSLLGFEDAADFEIHVGGWLGLPPSAKALPVRAEVTAMPPDLVQCFYGEEETDSFCPALAKTGIALIRTGGAHHFGRDYTHLTNVILNGWRRRMTKG